VPVRTISTAVLALAFAAAPLRAQTGASAAPGGTAASAASAAATPRAGAVTWAIDANHSELVFRIRHLVSRVNGTFREWGGTVTADPANLAGGAVDVTIKTASIDTRNERRDNHLRTGDFFLADSFPEITFKSRSVKVEGENVTVAGDLTMRGVTKPVVLEGRYLGITGTPGKRRLGFEASTRVNRLDYGVKWNRAAEGGGAVLGDEVDIVITVAAVETAP
jgi:polyisoprenoid-binding protein YceI